MIWILYSFGAAFFTTVMILLFRQIGLIGVSSLTMITSLFVIVSGIFVAQSLITKTSFNIEPKAWLYIFLASLASWCANYFTVNAINESPNPGYVMAISSLSIALIAVSSYFIFKDDLTLKTIIGIGLIMIGIFLIVK